MTFDDMMSKFFFECLIQHYSNLTDWEDQAEIEEYVTYVSGHEHLNWNVQNDYNSFFSCPVVHTTFLTLYKNTLTNKPK